MDDHQALAIALEQARIGFAEGGTPIGAVLVIDERVAGAGHNRRVQLGSAICHGETRSRGVEVVVVDSRECFDLLQEFVRAHPAVWNEDIGEV